MALYTERAMNHDQIADELMGLKTFRDNEVLYEDLGDGRRAFSGLKRISIRTLRKRISTIPFEIDFEKQSQDGSCTIIFGVAPKSDSNGSIGRPASLIDGRGSLQVQTYIASRLHSADAYRWLDTTPDSFDLICTVNGVKALRCKGSLLRQKHENPGAYYGRVAGKKMKR